MAEGLERLHKKAQQNIGSALEPDEEVLIAVPGEDGALAATNRRIFISKWGVRTGAFFANQINSWDLRNVSGVEYRTGLTTRSIVVQAPGTVPVSKFGRMDKGAGSVWEAPNALFVPMPADETVSRLRQLVADHQAPTAVVSAPSSEPDAADLIRKLAALRDDGILTQDEFDAKKRQILGI